MERYGNLVIYEEDIPELATLTPEERTFINIMKAACEPFNYMFGDQNYKYTNTLIEVFTRIAESNTSLAQSATIYVKFLASVHSIFDPRRGRQPTFAELAVPDITLESTMAAMAMLDSQTLPRDAAVAVSDLFRTKGSESVDGSINNSENNYYGTGFTDTNYSTITPSARHLNSHFELDSSGSVVDNCYHVGGYFGKQLRTVVQHLNTAATHAATYPAQFDTHTVRSLQLLADFFTTGNEETFREHCREWLAIRSRVQYTMGFIETYRDPHQIIGEAGAEITLRTVDTEHLGPLLLAMEQRLPVKPEHKRTPEQATSARINVNFNKILYAAGAYGPNVLTAAYCLPNYDDIRAECGSKQVIYCGRERVPLGNAVIAATLKTPRQRTFSETYDPDDKLHEDIWDLQVLLHETVGHASGRMCVPIDLYDSTVPDRAALEELRAEINALYMSVFETEELENAGLYKNWLRKLGVDELRKQLILGMVSTSLRRYLGQSPGFTKVTGAHARANVTIANWLMEADAIGLEEAVVGEKGKYTKFEFVVKDLAACMDSIAKLCCHVQTLKSTADAVGVAALFGQFTTSPITIEQGNHIHDELSKCRTAVMEGIEWTARRFPDIN